LRQQALSPPGPGGVPSGPGGGTARGPWSSGRLATALSAALWDPLPGLLLILLLALGWPAVASAAEVLQVRDSHLLQVGDRNRSYTVELVCYAVDPQREEAATAWLRQQLPRRTRVNLRPLGDHEGHLLARVSRLDARPDTPGDLGEGLIAAGLARASACDASAPPPSPVS
jgi:endonuclease YncB( thermonuclease family)